MRTLFKAATEDDAIDLDSGKSLEDLEARLAESSPSLAVTRNINARTPRR
ncbi:MAG: hypothetical protein O3A00_26355 [Planctomycetota bacterium]|nr:hypothetical protein [Planctomycetota bacterium]